MLLSSADHLPTQNSDTDASPNDLDRPVKLPPSLTGQWMERHDRQRDN